MRRIFCFILSALMLFICTSCGNGETKTYVNDRFMYTMEKTGYGEMTLFKYDIMEKEASVACPDPLCEHDENCLVTGIQGFTVTDEYVYLYRGELMKNIDVYVYDLSKNKIEFLISGSQVSSVYEAKDYAYFTLGEWVYNEEGELESQAFNQYRYCPKTKELKLLSEESLSGFANMQYHDDEKIIWYALGEGYFSTDYDFKNKQEMELPSVVSDLYDFKPERISDYGTTTRTMYRTNKETGEKVALFENADSFRWTDLDEMKSFLYIPTEIVLKKDDNGNEIYVRQQIDKISYVDAFDETITMTWDIPSNVLVANIWAEASNQKQIDAYIGMDATIITYDDNGNELYREVGVFIINYETGESFSIANEALRKYPDEK